MKNVLVILALATISSLANASGGFANLPKFTFHSQSNIFAPDQGASYDAKAELARCNDDYSKQQVVVMKLGYAIIDEAKCAISVVNTKPVTTRVEGSFTFLK